MKYRNPYLLIQEILKLIMQDAMVGIGVCIMHLVEILKMMGGLAETRHGKLKQENLKK